MQIFTMGFTKKSAKDFFEKVKRNKIQILVDVRLNNQSQLAGFTKGKDLEYFLDTVCQCKYDHNDFFAPTKDILDDYKKKKITWNEYVEKYNELIDKREIEKIFEKKYKIYDRVLLLCSEPTPENCHRRLMAEYLKSNIKDFDIEIKHI